MSLQEDLEDVNGALIQLIEQYDADLPREDRVQMVQEVRDLLSVAMQTAEDNAEDDLLNDIQELDHALEGAMNAPDNAMIGLLENAAVTSQNLVVRAEYMGGNRRPMIPRVQRRKKTLRKRSLRVQRKQRRKQTQRKRTHRRK